MKKIIFVMFILKMSIISYSQNREIIIPSSMDSLYTILLTKHIEFLEGMKSITKYSNDSLVIILDREGITNYLPKKINDKKIEALNYKQIKSYYEKNGTFRLTQINPAYFNDNSICIDFYIIFATKDMITIGEDGSFFKIRYDCNDNNYIIYSISH